MTVPGSAFCQDITRYRVELLVLTHLHHGEAPREMKWIEDYSDSVDYLTPPEPEEDEELTEGDETAAAEQPPAESPPGIAPGATEEMAGEAVLEEDDAEDLTEEDPATAVFQVEEMSVVMQDAWRRLRLSAPFRPEQYLSWEQGSVPPFPLLRVHDLEVVMIDDPYADLRNPPEEEGEEETVFGDTYENEPEDGEEEAEEEQLPDPTFYYRLDGTASLVRTRFLHLELDLQLREAVFEEQALPDPNLSWALPADEEADEAIEPRPTSFLVHRLQQRRQVKSGRMEYFDSPVLGVLAWVTPVEVAEAVD